MKTTAAFQGTTLPVSHGQRAPSPTGTGTRCCPFWYTATAVPGEAAPVPGEAHYGREDSNEYTLLLRYTLLTSPLDERRRLSARAQVYTTNTRATLHLKTNSPAAAAAASPPPCSAPAAAPLGPRQRGEAAAPPAAPPRTRHRHHHPGGREWVPGTPLPATGKKPSPGCRLFPAPAESKDALPSAEPRSTAEPQSGHRARAAPLRAAAAGDAAAPGPARSGLLSVSSGRTACPRPAPRPRPAAYRCPAPHRRSRGGRRRARRGRARPAASAGAAAARRRRIAARHDAKRR